MRFFIRPETTFEFGNSYHLQRWLCNIVDIVVFVVVVPAGKPKRIFCIWLFFGLSLLFKSHLLLWFLFSFVLCRFICSSMHSYACILKNLYRPTERLNRPGYYWVFLLFYKCANICIYGGSPRFFKGKCDLVYVYVFFSRSFHFSLFHLTFYSTMMPTLFLNIKNSRNIFLPKFINL